VSWTRRRLLRAAGVVALGAGAGCDRLPPELLPVPRPPPLPRGPFAVPEGAGVGLLRHVLDRLSFGPRPEDYGRARALGDDDEEAAERFIEEQLHPEGLDDPHADYALRRLEALDDPPGMLFEYQPEVLLDELTRGTLLRAVWSRRQLLEVMVRFWSDHFNVDASKGDCKWLKAHDDREVIRRHALGSFPELLRASALSPAMLWYLDGRQNRRRDAEERPNENYARELLELHTLGVDGGYDQRDVMEVARCLTGWTVRSEQLFGKGRVEFRRDWHDDGEKVVLGRRIPAGLGEQDLERVLEIVALHPSTARHLATKLCRRFIADQPPADAVGAVADAFLASGGALRPTLRTLFRTPAFRHPAQRRSKLKRPFRFVVSALRATAARTDGGRALEHALLRMGQAPFQCPTPDGYPDEAGPWLGTLLWRWHLAADLALNRLPGSRVDAAALRRGLGGVEGLLSHLFGRRPKAEERAALASDDAAELLALALASPAFQRH